MVREHSIILPGEDGYEQYDVRYDVEEEDGILFPADLLITNCQASDKLTAEAAEHVKDEGYCHEH